jgi:hypothetical protein
VIVNWRWQAYVRGPAALLVAAGCGLVLASGAAGRGTPAEFQLGFVVRVLGVEDSGKIVPLEGASVGVLPGGTSGSNASGYAFVKASPSVTAGETVTIFAQKNGYSTEHTKFFIDRDTLVRAQTNQTLPGRIISWLQGKKPPVITLTLQPQPGEDVQLAIQVKDANLNPVKGAYVSLDEVGPPSREVSHSYSAGPDGEATFLVPASLVENGLQAKVFAGKSGSRFSDISTSVLGGGGRRIFVVVLPGANGSTGNTGATGEKSGTLLTIKLGSAEQTSNLKTGTVDPPSGSPGDTVNLKSGGNGYQVTVEVSGPPLPAHYTVYIIYHSQVQADLGPTGGTFTVNEAPGFGAANDVDALACLDTNHSSCLGREAIIDINWMP